MDTPKRSSRSSSSKAQPARTPSVGRSSAMVYVPVSIRERRRGYGTMAQQQRSISVPVHSTRVVFYKRPPKQLTIGQQSAKLVEKASKHFFHANFNSAHGNIFTVPNRAQQMVQGRPSRGPSVKPISRTSSAVRKPPMVPLDTTPASSAMKKVVQDIQNKKDFLNEPIVVKRRAASADSRINYDLHDVELREKSAEAQAPPKIALPESSPDLFALEHMRESAKQPKRPALSPTTIAKAVRTLRMYEERKVAMPTGSFDSVEVAIDGTTIQMPEHTPLRLSITKDDLPPQPRRVQISNIVEQPPSVTTEDEEEEEETVGWCDGLIDLLYLTAPAAVSICFTFSMSVVPLAFIGSLLGESDLSGASVGYFITCILVIYPMMGLTFAMDTLCSHEYGRDPLSPEMGLVLQRGVIINLFFLVPMCFAIYNLHGFLISIYGPTTARLAEEFLAFVPMYILPMMLFICFTKFLNNQMYPHMPMIALTAGVIITPFLQLKLTPMGVKYTMLGMCITAWFQFFVVVLLTLFKVETRITLGTWRIRDALDWTDVKEYMKLAIPSAIFVAAEASSFDLTILLCAKFSEMDGAAWSAIMNSLFIFASFSGGLSASACANIGRCIGADDPKSAKRYVLLSIIVSFIVGVIDSIILVAGYDFFMSLFGTTGKTLELTHEVLFMLPFFHISDAVQFAFQGIFSGLGKNHIGAIILLTCLWGIGIPLSFLFGHFLDYRMYGVCVGLTLGLCIEAPVMVMVAATLDYQQVCDDFIEDEEEEESEEDEEETEEEEELDEEYVEEVMRRSGIPTGSNNGYVDGYGEEHLQRLLPPKRRRRRKKIIEVDEDEDY